MTGQHRAADGSEVSNAPIGDDSANEVDSPKSTDGEPAEATSDEAASASAPTDEASEG